MNEKKFRRRVVRFFRVGGRDTNIKTYSKVNQKMSEYKRKGERDVYWCFSIDALLTFHIHLGKTSKPTTKMCEKCFNIVTYYIFHRLLFLFLLLASSFFLITFVFFFYSKKKNTTEASLYEFLWEKKRKTAPYINA